MLSKIKGKAWSGQDRSGARDQTTTLTDWEEVGYRKRKALSLMLLSQTSSHTARHTIGASQQTGNRERAASLLRRSIYWRQIKSPRAQYTPLLFEESFSPYHVLPFPGLYSNRSTGPSMTRNCHSHWTWTAHSSYETERVARSSKVKIVISPAFIYSVIGLDHYFLAKYK